MSGRRSVRRVGAGRGGAARAAIMAMVVGAAAMVLPAAASAATLYSFSGTLRDENGAPMGGAQTGLTVCSANASGTGCTDFGYYATSAADGSFQILAPAGDAIFFAQLHYDPDNNQHVPHNDFETTSRFTFGADMVEDFVSPPVGTVTVTVLDSSNSPVSGRTVSDFALADTATIATQTLTGVSAIWSAPAFPRECTTDAAGQCTLSRLVGSSGTISVGGLNGAPPVTGPVVMDTSATQVTIQLPDAIVTYPFTGTLRTADLLPVPDAEVYLSVCSPQPAGAPCATTNLLTTTGADGTYAVAAPAGSAVLTVTMAYPPPNSRNDAQYQVLSPPFDLTGPMVEDITLPPIATARVAVVDETASPVSGARVSVAGVPSGSINPDFATLDTQDLRGLKVYWRAPTSELPLGCTTDQSGSCSFHKLLGSAGSIQVSPAGGGAPVTAPVTMTSDPTSVTVTLPSSPTFAFTGDLVDTAGAPVTGARVSLTVCSPDPGGTGVHIDLPHHHHGRRRHLPAQCPGRSGHLHRADLLPVPIALLLRAGLHHHLGPAPLPRS